MNTFIDEVVVYSRQPKTTGVFYEFEARMSNFDRDHFFKLMDKLKQMSENSTKKDWKPFELIEYTDFIIGGRRYSSIPGDTSIRHSDKIGLLARKEKNVKYALSQEREGDISEDIMLVDGNIKFLDEPQNIELTRKKKRTTFPVKDIKIDMTEVVQNGDIKYEVEVEIDSTKLEKNKQLFTQLVTIIDKFAPKFDEIIKFYNFCMTNGTKNNSDELIYGTVSRARDLKMEDITSCGILKNYSVSLKADGEYRFLIFHSSGIWLIYPKNMITRLGDMTEEYPEDTIIAGEYITKSKLRTKNLILDSESVFIPFDTTVIKGVNVAEETYVYRREKMMEILRQESYIKINGVNKIYILHKKYYDITSPDLFYSSVKDIFEDRDKAVFNDDGLVFTPIYSAYVTNGSRVKFKDRVLSRYDDICKWKPAEKQTLDFLYEFNNGNHIIKTKDRDIVDFKRKHLSSKFRFENLDSIKTMSGSIVEFMPIAVENGIVRLKPSRLRSDKIFPNEYYIVENGYELLINPINETTLMGEDTVLMRKHHNNLKRELLTDVPRGSILIDFGAGKGGDITKWRNFSKVLAIEPNISYIREMEHRIDYYKVRDKVTILNARGEDTDIISQALVKFLPDDLANRRVYFSFMFSLTFFWESSQTLKSLTNTINKANDIIVEKDGERAEMLFITIDGKRTKNLLMKMNTSSNSTHQIINLNTISLSHKEGDKSMNISMSDSKTVTETQKEYFVFIDQLFEGIKYMSPRMLYATNREDCVMSESEEIYTSLVIYGRAVYDPMVKDDQPLGRLPVHTDICIEQNGKKFLKGDDEIEALHHLGANIYRVATIDNGTSLQHSVLKLISNDYIKEDALQRYERCQRFIEKLNYNYSLENVSDVIKCTIRIFKGNDVRKIGDFRRTIFLYQNMDDTYEPVVREIESGEHCSVFE
jgi:hypothetical protein